MSPEPQNRLQKKLLQRWRVWAFWHLAFVVAIAGSLLMTNKTYAYEVSTDIHVMGTIVNGGPPDKITDGAGGTSGTADYVPAGATLLGYQLIWTGSGSGQANARITTTDQGGSCGYWFSFTPTSSTTTTTTHMSGKTWENGAFSTCSGGMNPLDVVRLESNRVSAEFIRNLGTQHYTVYDFTLRVWYDAPSTLDLASSTGTGALTGENITFTATYAGYPSTYDNMYFYPYGRGSGNLLSGQPTPQYIQIQKDQAGWVSAGSGGTVTFPLWKYPFKGSWDAKVIFTNCEALALNTSYNSCNIVIDTLPMVVTGRIDDDITYSTRLLDFYTPSNGINHPRYVDTPQPFEWRLPNVCSPSTITGKILYKGYPQPQALGDIGQVLSGDSGSGTLTFNYQSDVLNTRFYPYIKVSCANGSGKTLYNGSTFYRERATGLFVAASDWLDYWSSGYDNGGQTSDFNGLTGSGAQFFTDRQFYQTNEAVRMQFSFDTTFVPASLVIYPDPNQITDSITISSGALLAENSIHNYTITYKDKGKYYPKIRVRSSSYNPSTPSTYRDIWLGGNTTKDINKFVQITGEVLGTQNIDSNDGIFGLQPQDFRVSFGNDSNLFLQWAEDLLNIVIQAALYVASQGWNLLKNSPVFSFFDEAWHPVAGSTHTLPDSIWGSSGGFNPSDKTYVIQYADETASAGVKTLINLFILSLILRFILRSTLTPSQHVQRN